MPLVPLLVQKTRFDTSSPVSRMLGYELPHELEALRVVDVDHSDSSLLKILLTPDKSAVLAWPA